MNIAEAEKFFKTFNGQGYHMWHDETQKYYEFKELNIDSNIEEKWRQEIIQSYFENFFSEPDCVWLKHSRVLEVIASSKTKIEENCRTLLQYMERMDSLDKRQKMLVIESMAGRDVTQENGGCCLICTKTSLGEEMNRVMEKLMDFEFDLDDNIDSKEWYKTVGRLSRAVSSYRKAYEKFKR